MMLVHLRFDSRHIVFGFSFEAGAPVPVRRRCYLSAVHVQISGVWMHVLYANVHNSVQLHNML